MNSCVLRSAKPRTVRALRAMGPTRAAVDPSDCPAPQDGCPKRPPGGNVTPTPGGPAAQAGSNGRPGRLPNSGLYFVDRTPVASYHPSVRFKVAGSVTALPGWDFRPVMSARGRLRVTFITFVHAFTR